MRTTPDLQASTAAGRRLVAMAEGFAADFDTSAALHDRDGTFAHDHVKALNAAGFLTAPIPALFGGLGVMSVHDVLIAASRLARTDPATTIGVNMHLAVVANIVRHWRVAGVRGDARRAAALGATLQQIVGSGAVMAAAVSEPNPQDLSRPSTTATRTADGWVIRGTKSFCTLVPAADVLNVGVTTVDGDEPRYAFVAIPTAMPGVEVHDDWDALGMRASGSHSVSFHDVVLPPGAVRDGFPAGRFGPELLDRYLTSGAFHAAAALGIAEGAHQHSVARLQDRPLGGSTESHQITRLAENVVELAAMQATFDRAAAAIDAHHAAYPAGDAPEDALREVFAVVQAAKSLAADGAVRVVDRAMALSGGAGYRSADRLARAYRDARATAFMHPLGANRAADFIARATLGLTPHPN